MISWIVASHDPAILDSVLRPSLVLEPGDELIVVTGAPSIAVAYNGGTERASNLIRCYVHHDVRILNPPRLRAELLKHCTPEVGIVGVLGSRTRVMPWWGGEPCGSVHDVRPGFGLLDFSPGGEPCAYLDGVLLASAHELAWDEDYSGWHVYDHDICQQALAAGLTNWCLAGGKDLVRHETTSSADIGELAGWDANLEKFRAKWTG